MLSGKAQSEEFINLVNKYFCHKKLNYWLQVLQLAVSVFLIKFISRRIDEKLLKKRYL